MSKNNTERGLADHPWASSAKRDFREASLSLFIVDILCLLLGTSMLFLFVKALGDATMAGQIQLLPRYRGAPARTVPWPEAWSVLLGTGWISLLFMRYLWLRILTWIQGHGGAIRQGDVVLAISALPALAIYVCSGSLSTVPDALGTLLKIGILATTFLIGHRFGKGWAVGAFVVVLAGCIALGSWLR